MNISLTNDEVNIILRAVTAMPWLEVNELVIKLTDPPAIKKTVPIVTTPEAPYGLKKDGTPAKRRGRPSKKSRRNRK